MLSSSSIISEPLMPKSNLLAQTCGHSYKNGQREEVMVGNCYIGVLEVFIHRARDLHNICIYHKQDVYARVCLTRDPETKVSTQTINGGGQNPVFNQKLRLNVRSVDCSLKCEIWMLSRVKNYLEDQLLGFALVPLSDVLVQNGRLAKEFEMSSSDLFHSPSGFVELTIAYTGSSPEVLEVSKLPSSLTSGSTFQDSKMCVSVPCELDKIEFPDPKVASENEMMVTEYFAISCDAVDAQGLQFRKTSELSDQLASEDSHQLSPDVSYVPSEQLTNGTRQTFVLPQVEIYPSSDSTEEKKENGKEAGSGIAAQHGKENGKEADGAIAAQNGIIISLEAEQKVVQQDIVDMYMKSMKQFTEALAKMKLPLDNENVCADLGNNDDSGVKPQASKGEGPSPKVFYGSRAFF